MIFVLTGGGIFRIGLRALNINNDEYVTEWDSRCECCSESLTCQISIVCLFYECPTGKASCKRILPPLEYIYDNHRY